MDDSMNVDLTIVARDLKLPPDKIETTVELLDSGNTIPFITRFRKDLTGGLNEQQILSIKQRVAVLRAIAERKSFVLKSIESQGKLNDELKTQIQRASSSRRIEDLYLPFKPKKQSRASLARQQGLAPLAEDIFSGSSPDIDLATRATDFVRVDKGLSSVDDVIKGVGDLLIERFSENDEVRSMLRKIMWNDGKLASVAIVATETPESVAPQSATENVGSREGGSDSVVETTSEGEATPNTTSEKEDDTHIVRPSPDVSGSQDDSTSPDDSTSESAAVSDAVVESDNVAAAESDAVAAAEGDAVAVVESDAVAAAEGDAVAASPDVTASPAISEPSATDDSLDAPPETTNVEEQQHSLPRSPEQKQQNEPAATSSPKKKKKKKKKKKPAEDPFKDYQDFKQSLKQIPNHRVLAINRGERAGKLKVRIQLDSPKLNEAAELVLVPTEHPFSEFLKKCAGDALTRMMVPSLEREIRRELTEAAEKHAVEVFANNLRNLLLQAPIRNRIVLAIDPGFKRGCSVAVIDSCGNLKDSGHVFVVGNQSRRDDSKKKLVDWITSHQVDVIAIGNGAACRQTEQLVSDVIGENFKDGQIRYVMVNEAGASIYSTSEIGREEFPDAAPSIRSAASIGRRLLDPLSELVKISPANIGVGLYQHDVKAKHLSESLDEVVQFCVNRVGVNVNTASPSLLKYVSGLNALTARRVVEYRQANGEFKNRDQLKEVSGIGEATFIQAAGFLRIHGGDTPLDRSSIHPESYSIAYDVIKQVDASLTELFPDEKKPQTAVPQPPVDSKPESESIVAPENSSPETSTPEASIPQAATPDDPSSEIPVPEATVQGTPTLEANVEVHSQSSNSTDSSEKRVQSAQRKEIVKRISELKIDQIATEHSAGKLLVKDILMALKRPDWDPRDKVHKPIFRRGIIKPDDLKPEMQLDAQVVNVVDFGVFVDIGLGESSLVHVSQLSNQFIRDPHQFYAVGDVLKVWVSEVDSGRRRVKLTAIRPGSKKPQARRSRPSAKPQDAGRQSEARPVQKPGKYGNKYGGSTKAHSGSRNFDRQRPPRRSPARRSPPKPVPPITDGMLEGNEPMRSFSDLVQFVSKKPDGETKKKKDE